MIMRCEWVVRRPMSQNGEGRPIQVIWGSQHFMKDRLIGAPACQADSDVMPWLSVPNASLRHSSLMTISSQAGTAF
jgi:hypothetical protein